MGIAARAFVVSSIVLVGCGGSSPPLETPRVDRAFVDPHPPPLPWEGPTESYPVVESPCTALVGGTVMTAAGHVFEDGVLVMEDGRIRAVGPRSTTSIPTEAIVVDVTGRFVTPGFIDTHSHMGVYPVPSASAHEDGNEMTSPTTPQVRAGDSFWPQDPALYRALAAGVTTLQVLPGSANLIGGAGETIHLHPGRSVSEMVFPGAPETMKMACGENPKRVYGERSQFPSTRMGNVAGYRAAFQEALEYGRSFRRWQREHQAWMRAHGESSSREDADDAGEPGGGQSARNDEDDALGPPDPPARNFGHELVLGAIEGRVLVQVHCYRADEMARMTELAREMGFRIRAFHHAVEAYKIRDLLREADIAIATWTDWWGFKLEAFDAIPENLGLLTQSGVRAVLHSDSPMLVQRLGQEAGKALGAARARGIETSDDEALRWVTANAAWTLGIDDVVGTLEVGKLADVVVWSAHPFSVYAHAERVYVDGILEHERAVDPVGRRSDFELGMDLEPATSTASPALPVGRRAPPVRRDASRGAGGDGTLAIVGATVWTGETGDQSVIRDATVLVAGERIARVEARGAVPSGVDVVDARGLVLTPGLVALETPIGLVEIEQEATSRDAGHESSEDPIRAAFTAADGYNPLSTLIPVARLGGVTAALSTPTGGLVPGTSSFVDLAGRDRASVVRTEVAALHVDLTDDGISSAHGARPAAIARLRRLFDDARLYARRREAFDRAAMRETGVSRLDLERIASALDGSIPVVVRVSRASDIEAVLRFAEEQGIRLVLSGAEEGWMIASRIAAAGVPVVVQPLANLPTRFDTLRTRYDNAALLAAAGVRIAFHDPGAWDVRNLRQQAGNAVAWGLAYDVALAAVTSVPAEIAGRGDDYGRIAPGMVASVALWNGDPFETTTSLSRLWVRGRDVPLRSRQTELFERYRDMSRVRRGQREFTHTGSVARAEDRTQTSGR